MFGTQRLAQAKGPGELLLYGMWNAIFLTVALWGVLIEFDVPQSEKPANLVAIACYSFYMLNQHRRMFALREAPDLTTFGLGGYVAPEDDFPAFLKASGKTLAQLERDFWFFFWLPPFCFVVMRIAMFYIAHI